VVANLGNLAFARSDWDAAGEHFTESLEVERVLGNVFGVARALNNLGETAQQQGKPERAQRLYLAANQLFVELHHDDYATYTANLLEQLHPLAQQLPHKPLLSQPLSEIITWATT
jgi:tetratricopeptide (TPR) repeat protein